MDASGGNADAAVTIDGAVAALDAEPATPDGAVISFDATPPDATPPDATPPDATPDPDAMSLVDGGLVEVPALCAEICTNFDTLCDPGCDTAGCEADLADCTQMQLMDLDACNDETMCQNLIDCVLAVTCVNG